jgi:hypothetical protein
MTILQELCARTDHVEGYYELVFLVPDQRAIDVLFDHLQTLYDLHKQPNQPPLRLLLNFSNGVTPSLRQLGFQIQQFRKNNPDRIRPRIVILYANAFMQMTSDLFVRMFSSRQTQTQVRLMPPTHRSEAIAWLLQE